MHCLDVREQLSAYIDGMLDSSLVPALEEHLASCRECSAELAELKAAVEMVRQLPEVVPPPEFRDNLRRQLLTVQAAGGEGGRTGLLRRLTRGKWSGVLAVAALAFLTIGITTLWYAGHGGGLIESVSREKAAQESSLPADRAKHRVATGSAAVEHPPAGAAEGSAEGLTPAQQPAPEGEQPAPTAETGGVRGGAAVPETVERQLTVQYFDMQEKQPDGQPPGDEESFSISALPRSAPEAGPTTIVAVECTVELTANRADFAGPLAALAEKYDGLVEKQPAEPDGPWILRVPAARVDPFVDELGQLGRVVNRNVQQRDLAEDIKRLREEISELQEQERLLTAEDGAPGEEDELAALRKKITERQKKLVNLEETARLATIKLMIK